MDKQEKWIWSGICVLAAGLMLFLISGAYHKYDLLNKEKLEPFIPDRVVTVRIVMDEKDWQWLRSSARSEQYVRADFWFDGYQYPNVAVRPKGNSSLMSVAGSGSSRLSLKVDFNFFNSARTFRGLKKLNLNNGFSDPTYIREVLGYEIFKNMGLPTPRTAFVDVYVNDTHLGLYTQVEPIDKSFLARHFDNPNGNLYKPEIGAATLNWTAKDLSQQSNSSPQPQQQNQLNLALNIGGTRLADLLRLMERERSGNSPAAEQNPGFGGGMFPGGPGFGPGMPPFPGPQGGFPPNPGQFPQGGNMPFPPAGPMGGPMSIPPGGQPFAGRPGDPNGLFANSPQPFPPGIAGGPAPMGPGPDGRPFDPNQFQRFMADGNRGGQGGRGFQGGPGGPGMPGFGRGGNLLETMGLKTNENYQNHSALLHFLEVLNNTPDDSFPAEIEKVLNVDQVLRYLAVSSMLVHLDNYTGMGHNYYLYETNGYFTIIPWDLNMAFGTFRMGAPQGDIAEFYIDEPVTSGLDSRPLVKRLLAYPPYLERYHQYHEQLLAGDFAEGVLEKRIDQWVSLIRPYVEKDELKFFTMEQFEKGLTEGSADMNFMGMGMPGPGNMNNLNERRPAMAMEKAPEMSEKPQEPAANSQQNQTIRPGNFGPFGRQERAQMGNNRGRMGGFGGGPGGMGMGAPGLKSFIAKRRISVRKQLDGELPSRPTAQQRQQNNQWPMMFGPGGMM
ncbi:CotH kinase family protein [Anaerohalosphaeraceae bacterium U12dextr]